MNVQYNIGFIRSLRKLSKKDALLRKKVVEKVNLYLSDKKHPSLRLHKLQGKLKDAWNISIDRSVRILIHQEGDDVVFVHIGSHDEVYR